MDHTKKVEKILWQYRSLVAAVEMDDLLPSIIAKYESDGGRGSEVSKPTEKYALLRMEKVIQVQQINRALGALTHKERDLVERKYFNPDYPQDSEVFNAMGMGQTSFYRLKTQTLRKIAMALNFI